MKPSMLIDLSDSLRSLASLLVLDSLVAVLVELIETDVLVRVVGSECLDRHRDETELDEALPTGSWGHLNSRLKSWRERSHSTL